MYDDLESMSTSYFDITGTPKMSNIWINITFKRYSITIVFSSIRDVIEPAWKVLFEKEIVTMVSDGCWIMT